MRLDKKSSLSIEPAAVERYLRSSGWSVESVSSPRVAVYTKEAGRKHRLEVLVPTSSAFADYPVRLAELVATLAEEEQRSRDDIVRDLKNASGAVVLLRGDPDRADDPSVPLLDGIALTSAGLQMVAAATRAAAARLVEHVAWRPRLITAYVAAVRVAPAEPGSYVIPLVLPDEVPYSAERGEVPAGFGAHVRREFERILDQVEVHASQEQAGELPAYFRAEETSFWNALGGLASARELDSVSVELDPTLDRLGATISRRVFRFDSAALSRIQEGSPYHAERHVAARTEPPHEIKPPDETRRQGVQLVGQVIRLERPSVGLRTELDGRPRTVRVRLALEEEYERAIEAHRGRNDVLCAGELVLSRGGARLESVYSFEILR